MLQRGYKQEEIDESIQKASGRRREDCLQPTIKKKEDRVPLVITYNPNNPPLNKITKELLPILHSSDRMKKAVPTPPIIAYKRPKNLIDLLVRADISPPHREEPGNQPCGRSRCKTCPTLVKRDTFTSKATSKEYKLTSAATCKSSNLVYLISCKKCGHQYVGETEQPLNERMNSHRSDITTKNTEEKPVAAHFNFPGHSVEDMQVMVIDQLWKRDTTLRKIRESKWISTLETYQPKGMNLRRDRL